MYVVSSWNTLNKRIYQIIKSDVMSYMCFIEVDLELLLAVGEDLDTLAEELNFLAVFYLKTHFE